MRIPTLIRVAAISGLLTACLVAPLRACINYYGTDVHGHRKEALHYSPEEFMERLTQQHPSREELLTKKAVLERDIAAGLGYKAESDLAATLIYLGEYRRAIMMLEPLAEKYTDEYTLAANLGTAYELAGDDVQALKWIKEGIRRDATGHNGSEWLHVKILEAKIRVSQDPDWLKEYSVSGMDFGDGTTPRPADDYAAIARLLPPRGDAPGLEGSAASRYRSALHYQLGERMGFVKPPDAIVGDLLFDLANVVALDETVEYAVPVYELAIKYGAPRASLAHSRVEQFQSLEGYGLKEDPAGVVWNYIFAIAPWVCVGTFVLLIGLAIMIGHGRKPKLPPKQSSSLFAK